MWVLIGSSSVQARFQSCAIVVVMALLLSLGIGAPATAAVPVTDTPLRGVQVTATGGDVLAGGTRTISVSGSNPDGVDLFNALVVVLLPVGVTYAAGSVQPAGIGAPDIQSWVPDAADIDPGTGLPRTAQVLVWSNIADLPVGSEFSASFGVTADPDRYPAGSTFEVGAGLYANSDERVVPDVTVPSSGAPEITGATEGGSSEATVTVVPITITKNETANAEAEVYRGPANPATFELRVTAAPDGATTGAVVVDYVPAQFTVTECTGDFPCTRRMVEVDGEVFTEITWNLGTIDANETNVLRYSAYVGEREITMPSGQQTGADTRPGAEGYEVENTATLTGTYTGDVAAGTDTEISVSDTATVRVIDLGIVKSTDGSGFVGGQTKQYTLAVRSSQFVSSSGITVTDTLPNGMCPVLPAGVAKTGSPWPDECAAAGAGNGTVTGATMTSVDFDASGVFTVVFAVDDLAADQDVTIGYTVYMRTNYQNGTPTAAGDDFANSVVVTGTTTDGSGATSDASNGSSADIGTGAPTLSKTIWPNLTRTPITGVTGVGTTCQSGDGAYVSPTIAPPAYQLGDLVCFRLDMTFPQGVSTRSVNVSDYLPSGMSIVDWAATSANSTTITPVGTVTGVASARWVLGEPDASNVLFVEPGATGSFYLLARVNTVPATAPRVAGNLAKMRYTGPDDRVINLRDQADLKLSPPPPLGLDKKVDGAESLSPVQEGQLLTFTIDVSHNGSLASSTADPIDEIEVWDVLPAGFDCDDIDSATPAINPIADCFQQANGQTRVTWILRPATPLIGGQTATITYALTVPSPLSISSSHTNTAAVTRYTPITTDGITPSVDRPTFYPANPVGAYPDKTKNAPQAADTATISLAGASVAKSVTSTSVTESNNSALTQATIGETVVWQYTATIPARTSIFNGILADGLPVGGRLTAVDGAVVATGPSGAVIADGCTQDPTQFRLCNVATDPQFGSLIFPTTWTNSTESSQTFTVEMTTRVADVAGNTHNSTISNTAALTSTPTTTNANPVSRGTAAAQVTVVVPNVAMTKGASTTASTGPWTTSDTLTATGGQTVYYRLEATNTTVNGLAVAPLHDTLVVDCIDARLSDFTNFTASAVATVSAPVAGDGINGCAIGRTKYVWTLTADLATTAQIVYSATVPTPIAAGTTFRNDAALTGSTLAGAVPGERTLTATANRTVTAAPPTIVKQRLLPTGTAVPGENVTWRLTLTIPQDVTLLDAQIRDTLPAELGTADAASFVLSCGTGWDVCPTGTRVSSGNAQILAVGIGDVAASAQVRTLILEVTSPVSTSIAATAVGPYTNSGQATWRTVAGGTTLTSNTSTATVGVRHPLVTTAKSVSNPTVAKSQGEIFTYTVSASAVQNATPNGKPAFNVTVVDRVPVGVIPVVSATDSTALANGATVAGGGVWDSTARTITWMIATLTPGDPAMSFSYPAKLDLASTLSGAALVNTATPTSWDSLAGGGKRYTSTTGATASVTPAFPKIDTAKQLLSTNPVYIGDEVSYSFTMTNSGTARAVSLQAIDTLPAGWTYVAGSAQLGGVALADPAISGQQLTWSNLGPLAPAAALTITYRAIAGSSVSVGSGVAHTNTVRAAQVTDATGGTSYNSGNGSYIGTSGTATARIDQADLQITKTAGTFTAGGTGSFPMVVRNNGGDTAVGVALHDVLTLPTGVTVTTVNAGTDGTCTVASGVLDCTRASLNSGATWTVTLNLAIAADVVSGTEVPNTATVSARTADRTPGNNSSTATGTVVTSADLEVVKRVVAPAAGAVVAGTPIEWSITLTNKGPSLSRGSANSPIVLTDTVPAAVSGLSLTGTVPPGCTLTGQAVRCEITHDMTVGEAITLTVAGTVNSDVAAGTGVIVNTASVTPVTTDPVAGNNSSTTRTDVAVQESLTIVKTITDPAPPAEVVPGETLTYTLQVSNGGPSVARGVYIVDTLPADIDFDELVSGTGWTATPGAGGTVRFDYSGVLAAGADAPLITYTATLDPAFIGLADDLTNTASVSSAWKADQDDSDATPGTPNPEADLELTKTVAPSSGASAVIAGETAVYTFTVANNGPSDAGTVTVRDTLPVGLTASGPLPDGCTIDGRLLTCVLDAGLDEDDAPWTFQVAVRVDASFTGATLTNAAAVTSVTDDINPDNNTDTATLNVIQRAKLAVAKVPSAATVTAGENVTWTITVANSGPSDAQNVTLSDVVPGDLIVVSATSADAGVTCSGTATVSCTIGTLAAGASVQIALVTTVRSSIVNGSTIPNSATANSSTPDVVTGEPATATGGGQIGVIANAALTIVKATTTPVVSAGATASFTVLVGNDGPSDAAAPVTITDTLPAGLTYVSSSTVEGPAVWACDDSGQDVVCVLQNADGDAVSLAAGAKAPLLQIVAAIDPALAAGTVTNTATVTSPSDSTPPTDTADVDVQTFADLGILKQNVGTPTAGEEFSWTITVTNHGPSDSVATADEPITVTDKLPAGTTYVSATGAGVSCDEDAGVVTCEITSTMKPGDAVAVTLTVAVDEAVSGTLTNTASVAPGVTDEPQGAIWPNEFTVVTPTVIEVADLAIEKSVVTADADIVAGQPISWELTVTNLGPSNSDADAGTPIVVTDALPSGVLADAATGPSDDWSCTIAGDRKTVTCELSADLATNDPQTISVTGTIDPSVQGRVANTAAVAPGLTAQPDTEEAAANDRATASADVTESADLVLSKAISETIEAGATGEYTLTVTNLGPSAARGITLVDTLPTGLSFDSASGDGWACAPDTGDPAQVECAYAGILTPAQTLSLRISIAVDEALQGEVVNTATVAATTPDPDLENNTASVPGTVAEMVDLSIVKTPVGDPIVGETFSYELTVANAGPATARGLLVDDLVPGELEIVSVSAEGWSCATDAETGAIACTLAELAQGATAPVITIEVRVLPAAYPEVSNTATVSSTTPEDESTLGDNTSTAIVPVPPLSTLTITKELTDELVTGSQAHYSITVTNSGPTADPGPVSVTDTMPQGIAARSATLSGAAGSCAIAAATVTCTIDALAVDQTAVVTLTVDVAANARGEIVNTARASSPASGAAVEDTAAGIVRVVELPSTGGTLGLFLPFGVGLLGLGLLALWWARRRRTEGTISG